MSIVLRPRVPSSPVSQATLSAIAWHALLKTADKEAVRDNLTPATSHVVNLTVSGDVDGQAFERHIAGVLSVGSDSTRATSATPDLNRVVGSILAKLNERTRAAILRDLPEQFAEAGCELPEVSGAIAEETAVMLSRLRAKKSIAVRGSVSVKYRLDSDGDSDGGDSADGGSEDHPATVATGPRLAPAGC